MPRAGLDADVVTRCAAAMLDADGTAAPTGPRKAGGTTGLLARVAQELGVATPSLYKHVGGLDDLMGRVAAAATWDLAGRLGRAVQGRSGRDALESLAEEYRRFAHDHPATYPLTQRHRTDEAWTAAAAESLAVVAAALSGYGVTADDVDRIRFVRATVHGFVDLERRGGFGLPASVDASFAFTIDALDITLQAGGGGSHGRSDNGSDGGARPA
ncbi:TetR family transcriptional regulator [Paraoerskovia sediminicola]|uniref:TetR family transcriptional regulator n=1 Tax=Paraoerskovia sediminicola TaxID=1138587 RepID=A0ABM8G3A6_9CELL|nr:TetR-like C-terminal domain-containing protein [Paraoerskovia sediminicola]BDZ42515.1 TetR family transcriptional regulator [Paraoerskovia sediminicola]